MKSSCKLDYVWHTLWSIPFQPMTTNHHFQQLLLPQKTDHPSDLSFKRKQQQRTLTHLLFKCTRLTVARIKNKQLTQVTNSEGELVRKSRRRLGREEKKASLTSPPSLIACFPTLSTTLCFHASIVMMPTDITQLPHSSSAWWNQLTSSLTLLSQKELNLRKRSKSLINAWIVWLCVKASELTIIITSIICIIGCKNWEKWSFFGARGSSLEFQV